MRTLKDLLFTGISEPKIEWKQGIPEFTEEDTNKVLTVSSTYSKDGSFLNNSQPIDGFYLEKNITSEDLSNIINNADPYAIECHVDFNNGEKWLYFGNDISLVDNTTEDPTYYELWNSSTGWNTDLVELTNKGAYISFERIFGSGTGSLVVTNIEYMEAA